MTRSHYIRPLHYATRRVKEIGGEEDKPLRTFVFYFIDYSHVNLQINRRTTTTTTTLAPNCHNDDEGLGFDADK